MSKGTEAKPTAFNRIEEVIEDLREGKTIIVLDDEDRENEGDLVCAAEHVTPEIVNFEKGITLPVSGAIFFRCAGLGHTSSSTTDMRTRMSSLVTLKTM